MRIRLATADDGAKLWELAEALIASQVALGAADQRKTLALGIKHGVENGEAIVVAEDEGELVGFCAWTGLPNTADGEAVGLGTYVAPTHRDLGIATSMRQFAKTHLAGKGYTHVVGQVLVNNEPGKASAGASNAEIIGYVLRWRL